MSSLDINETGVSVCTGCGYYNTCGTEDRKELCKGRKMDNCIMDDSLFEACTICVADAGKEDNDLVLWLYHSVYQSCTKQKRAWTYNEIDALLEKWCQMF